jgi:fatty-acyl-CoA synthase
VKDTIIGGGDNVDPAEVENVIYHHPDDRRGGCDRHARREMGGDRLRSLRMKAGQRLELKQRREFAGAQLARYKLPRRLEIVRTLPRNATGKILKTKLRTQLGRTGDVTPR